MLMIRVNVPLKISRRIFAYGEIIQMHTFHDSYYIVIKQPSDGDSKAKKVNQKTIPFIDVCKHN